MSNPDNWDLVHSDLSDLLEALGLPPGPYPESPHRVMRMCVETVRTMQGFPCLHSCGGRWVPVGSPVVRLVCLACGDSLAGSEPME